MARRQRRPLGLRDTSKRWRNCFCTSSLRRAAATVTLSSAIKGVICRTVRSVYRRELRHLWMIIDRKDGPMVIALPWAPRLLPNEESFHYRIRRCSHCFAPLRAVHAFRQSVFHYRECRLGREEQAIQSCRIGASDRKIMWHAALWCRTVCNQARMPSCVLFFSSTSPWQAYKTGNGATRGGLRQLTSAFGDCGLASPLDVNLLEYPRHKAERRHLMRDLIALNP